MTQPVKLYVGETRLPRRLDAYAKNFNLAEVRAESQRLPKLKALEELGAKASADFRFSVLLPRSMGTLEQTPEVEKQLAFAEKVIHALSAKWVILQTTPTVFPSDRTRRRLGEWVERLAREGRYLGWEPHGIWEADEVDAWADDLGIHAVLDASRAPVASRRLRYVRVRSLGEASRVRPHAVETLAHNLAASEEALVVFEGADALRAARGLREVLAEGHAQGLFDEEDDDQEVWDGDEAEKDDSLGAGDDEFEGDEFEDDDAVEDTDSTRAPEE